MRSTLLSNTEGVVKTYTLTVRALSDNAGYGIAVAPKDQLSSVLGGVENAASVLKNKSSAGTGSTSTMGYTALLNGDGDYYRYIADEPTFITTISNYHNNLAFDVIDAQTNRIVYCTGPQDKYMEKIVSSTITLYSYFSQKRLVLKAGHEYYIHVYTTYDIPITDVKEQYRVSIGLPQLSNETLGVQSSDTFSIPANVEKTFTVKVSGRPSSERLLNGKVSFTPPKTVQALDLTSVQIIAPNGRVFVAPRGVASVNDNPQLSYDVANFVDDPNLVPVNGTWTIKVKASKAISGLKLKLSGNSNAIIGSTELYEIAE